MYLPGEHRTGTPYDHESSPSEVCHFSGIPRHAPSSDSLKWMLDAAPRESSSCTVSSAFGFHSSTPANRHPLPRILSRISPAWPPSRPSLQSSGGILIPHPKGLRSPHTSSGEKPRLLSHTDGSGRFRYFDTSSHPDPAPHGRPPCLPAELLPPPDTR